MESKKTYPTVANEVSATWEIKHQKSYGAFMLLEEDLGEEAQKLIQWLNKKFAPDFRIIYKPTGSAMPISNLGSVGWKTRIPEPEVELTSSEVLNGIYAEGR